MGRTALFLVLGLGAAMGFIGFQMYRSGEIAADTQYAYLKYTNARNLARTAVHVALRTYDRSQTPSTGVYTDFGGGKFRLDSLRMSSDGDTLWLVSKGAYVESTYTVRVTLFRTTKPFPTVGAAIGIRAKPVGFTMNGHPEVNGNNYKLDGTTLAGSGNLPGVTTMTATDSATVASTGGTDVKGVPPVKVDTTTVDPLAFLEIYKENADFRYDVKGTYSGTTWGDTAHPAIVYCNAGDDTSFSIKFTGKVEGCGVLVVRGNVQFNGNLDFKGLVIVDGFNTVVDFGAAGTPAIVGGIIVAGNAGASVTLKGTGANAKARYSSEALAKARNIGKLRYYTILDWYE